MFEARSGSARLSGAALCLLPRAAQGKIRMIPFCRTAPVCSSSSLTPGPAKLGLNELQNSFPCSAATQTKSDPEPTQLPPVHVQGRSDMQPCQQSTVKMDSPAEHTCKEVSDPRQSPCKRKERLLCDEERPKASSCTHLTTGKYCAGHLNKHQALHLCALLSCSTLLPGGPLPKSTSDSAPSRSSRQRGDHVTYKTLHAPLILTPSQLLLCCSTLHTFLLSQAATRAKRRDVRCEQGYVGDQERTKLRGCRLRLRGIGRTRW